MKTYSFESLKRKAMKQARKAMEGSHAGLNQPAVIAAVITSRIEGNGLNWRDNYAELKEKVLQQIEDWDARNVKSLIAAFPSIVNKSHALPSAQAQIDFDENQNWVITFA